MSKREVVGYIVRRENSWFTRKYHPNGTVEWAGWSGRDCAERFEGRVEANYVAEAFGGRVVRLVRHSREDERLLSEERGHALKRIAEAAKYPADRTPYEIAKYTADLIDTLGTQYRQSQSDLNHCKERLKAAEERAEQWKKQVAVAKDERDSARADASDAKQALGAIEAIAHTLEIKVEGRGPAAIKDLIIGRLNADAKKRAEWQEHRTKLQSQLSDAKYALEMIGPR